MSTPAGRATESAAEPEQLRRDIEQTRARLGETVEELAHRADVPARVKEKVHATADTVQAKTAEVTAKAKDLGSAAVAKVAPPAREGIETVISTARRRPAPMAAIAAAVLLVLWWLLRRGR